MCGAIMTGFLDWLMNTSIAQWVGMSPSIWAFPTVLVFHTVGLALLVGTNVIIDLRVLGARDRKSVV